MRRDEQIEKMARAMCERDGFAWDAASVHQTANGEEPEQQREYWRDKADAALSAALSIEQTEPVKVKASPSDVFQVLAEFYRNGEFDFSHAPEMSRRLSAIVDVPTVEPEPVATYFARQIEWSRETFGPALRTKGVIDHIRKELTEIEREPHDLSEWIDVVILAMDGFWRHGGKAEDLLPALLAKQQKNMARTWPDWRTMSEDSAIQHDRSNEAHPPVSALVNAQADADVVEIPAEPTDEMIEAGEEEIASRRSLGCRVYAPDVWAAMVASLRPAEVGSATTSKGCAE